MSFDLSHLPVSFADIITDTTQTTGFPEDQILLIGLLLASIVFGQLHRYIHGTFTRHIISLILGLLYGYVCFGWQFAHCIVMPLIGYGMIKAGLKPHFAGVWAIGYLSLCHLWRMKVDYLGWRMDFSSSLMIAVVKTWTFAYNYSDYSKIKSAVSTDTAILHKNPKIDAYMKKAALREEPNLFYFMSYIMFYAGLLAGPFFEYNHYIDFQNESLFKKRGFDTTPPSFGASLLRLLYALLCFPPIFLRGLMPMVNFIETPAYAEKFQLYERIIYYFSAVSAFRYQYYFAWYLAESGCVSSGLGFNPDSTKEKVKWDFTSNVVVKNVEYHATVVSLTNNWNKGINNWLKYHVFFRIDAPREITSLFGGSRTFAMLATRVIASFWHGFYPTYYLFFLSIMIVNFAEESIQNTLEYLNIPEGTMGRYVANYLRHLYTMITMNYYGIGFVLLRGDWTLAAWRNVYYCGHVIPIVAWIALKLLIPKQVKTVDITKVKKQN